MLYISASNGVVLATEKKQKSILYDEQSVHKVEPITKHIGMVYSGMGPDYRWVVSYSVFKYQQKYFPGLDKFCKNLSYQTIPYSFVLKVINLKKASSVSNLK